MAAKQSDTNKYQSSFGGGFITFAQLIAEIICERLSRREGKDLPVKFWNLATWKKQFLTQVLQANSLLKLFSPKAIITAIHKDKKSYSLRAPWLIDAIQQEQDMLDVIAAQPLKQVTPIALPLIQNETPRQEFVSKKSKIKKLRELDE